MTRLDKKNDLSNFTLEDWNERSRIISSNVNYYIYKHYLNNELFYIGKGSGPRAFNFKSRSKEWLEFVDGRFDEILVDIDKTFTLESKALLHEKLEIEKHKEYSSLVNCLLIDREKNNPPKTAIKRRGFTRADKLAISMNSELSKYIQGLEEIKIMEIDIILFLLSQPKRTTEGESLSTLFSYKEMKRILRIPTFTSGKFNLYLDSISSKYNILDYESFGKTVLVTFSKSFSELINCENSKIYSLSFSSFLDIKNLRSKVLYLYLNDEEQCSYPLTKSGLRSLLNLSSSYDEYNFARKALIPAISDNLEFFEDLRLEDFHGRSLPEVCKFSFKKKRAN